jgi:hypothetical protein
MKTTKWLGSVAVLVVSVLSGYAQTPAPEQAQTMVPANISAAATEVVKLATSGVGDEVVLAYIKNCQSRFNLTADNVLYLKDVGLSAEVTSAMLNHDKELRSEPQQYAPAPAAPPPPAPAAEPAPAAAPAAEYVTSAPPDVTYFYSDLAPYGTWVQLEGYGWCWQPTAVVITPGWRPYCHGGNWVYSDLGWYWQSTYSWGWAPFHYGRWQHHARCGWVWLPDRVWGPAWVTWRTAGDNCGWAPLPPHAVFDVRLGWCYNGVAVGASFGFNLGSDAFLFVSFGDFCSHDLHRRCLPPARVTTIYHQTTVVNNYVVHNNRIEHRGIPIDRVSHASRVPVPRATVHDWASRPDRMPSRSGSVVYRPRLEAPARPVRMEAQRIDAQHPVIQHTPSGPPRGERTAAPGRGNEAAAGSARRPAVESPRAAPWTSSAKPEPSRQIQSTPSTPQRPPPTPAGRAPVTSDWSGGAKPMPAPQTQSTPRAPQPAPAAPVGQNPRTSDWSGGAKPKPAPQIQPTPSFPQKLPAASPGSTPQSSSPARDVRPTISTKPELAPTAPPSVPTIPAARSTRRPPDDWKQGTRSAPGYRSDVGLPALSNAREAAQASSAASPSVPSAANPHTYQPKGYHQAAELKSQPRSDAVPSTASPGSSGKNR